MNEKIIIVFTILSIIFGGSSVLIAYYRSKNQESLEVKEKQKEKKRKDSIKDKKKKEEEETTDIPWLYTWKGEMFSVSISVIVFFSSRFFLKKRSEKINYLHHDLANDSIICLPFIATLIFEILINPLLFAIRKFRKEKYHQRLRRLFSIFKIIIISIIFVFIFITFRNFYKQKNAKLSHLFFIFCKPKLPLYYSNPKRPRQKRRIMSTTTTTTTQPSTTTPGRETMPGRREAPPTKNILINDVTPMGAEGTFLKNGLEKIDEDPEKENQEEVKSEEKEE